MDSQNYYTVLGIDTNASIEDIRKAYKKLAIKHHPDKGGNIDTFREINNAYETLSNPETRRYYDMNLYNQHNMNNVHQNHSHFHHVNPMDIFNRFFNNNFDGFESVFFNNIHIQKEKVPEEHHHTHNKCADLHCNIQISLEDVYHGKNIKLILNVEKLCDDCIGVGFTMSTFIKCEQCNGIGSYSNKVQINQHVCMETTNTCIKCNGKGKILDIQYQCKTCNGGGIIPKNIIQEIKIPPLIKNNTIIKINNGGIEKIGFRPGDIIVHIITIDKNDTFTRLENNDLFIKKEITLAESLCGVDFNITHLSGKVIKIISDEGDIIRPGDIKKIIGEGMDIKNDLIIEFVILFPQKNDITKDIKEKLKELLVFKENNNDTIYNEKKILNVVNNLI